MSDQGLIRYLTLWPTTRCNMACVYCYGRKVQFPTARAEGVGEARSGPDRPKAAAGTPSAGNCPTEKVQFPTARAEGVGEARSGPEPQGSMPQEMSLDTAFAALDLCDHGLPFHVQLAGGEPCLSPEILKAVVSRIREKKMPATIALQTNGTCISVSLARFLREHHVGVGLSIDGPLDIQEKLRGRAKETLQGLSLLASEGMEVRVTAVLSAHNATRLHELALLLAHFPNVRGLALDPLVRLGGAKDRPDLMARPEDIRKGLRLLHATLKSLAHRRAMPFVWREQALIRKALAASQSQSKPYLFRGDRLDAP